MKSLLKKYAPKNLTEIIEHQKLVTRLINVTKNGNLKNMILVGDTGIGKTEIIHNLIKEIYQHDNECILELNTTDDRGINIVRDKIKMFSQKKVNLKKGHTKLIILDEADTLTQGAQQALRRMMELYSNTTRFIFICNQIDYIIEPIQSRCCIYQLNKISLDNIISKLIDICIQENINYELEGIKKIALISNGDLRQAIQSLETVFIGFEIIKIENIDKICDVFFINHIIKIVEDIYKQNNFQNILNKLNMLLEFGYSFVDIIQYFFTIIKQNDTLDNKHKLLMIKELSLINIRVINGIQSKLQLIQLLDNLYKVIKT